MTFVVEAVVTVTLLAVGTVIVMLMLRMQRTRGGAWLSQEPAA